MPVESNDPLLPRQKKNKYKGFLCTEKEFTLWESVWTHGEGSEMARRLLNAAAAEKIKNRVKGKK